MGDGVVMLVLVWQVCGRDWGQVVGFFVLLFCWQWLVGNDELLEIISWGKGVIVLGIQESNENIFFFMLQCDVGCSKFVVVIENG